MPFHKRPGQTTNGLVRVDQDTVEIRDALLYDFDIDDDELKLAHKQYLAQVMRFMADRLAERKAAAKPGQKAWTVSIDGYASRTGDTRHNELLSAMREQSVAAYFRLYLAMKPALESEVHVDTKYHGFKDTTVLGENPFGRSVRVVIHRPGLLPAPKPVAPATTLHDFHCTDASSDIVNVLDRFFTLETVIKVASVQDMVSKLMRRLDATPGARIGHLLISGHGAPGFQAVGCSTDYDQTGAKSLQVDPVKPSQLLGPAAIEMARLIGKFGRQGGISLFGCEVGHGPDGHQLLRTISRTVGGAWVEASNATQRPLIPGWEGRVYRCQRDTCWITRYGYVAD